MGELSSIILAGGKSTRMGFDKQLLEIDGELIVKYLGRKLRQYYKEIVVVTNTPELYEGEDFILTKDIYPGYGPMAGIHAGLEKITTQGAYVMACDMPNISGEFIEYINSLFFNGKDLDGIVSIINGYIEPMNGIYAKSIIIDLENSLKSKDLKLKDLIKNNNFCLMEEEKIKSIIKNIEIFENINDIEDLERFNKNW